MWVRVIYGLAGLMLVSYVWWSAIASSSVATEWLKGRTVDDCMTIKNTDIAYHLKLPPVKLHCSMLAEDAIKSAIADYKSKQNQQS